MTTHGSDLEDRCRPAHCINKTHRRIPPLWHPWQREPTT